MRKLGIIILIVAALIIVAALVVPKVVNVNRYHDRIQAELQKRLNRPVSLGQMRLSVLPLAFRVDNAVIGDDPSFHSTKPFAQVDQLDVSAKLWPLLHGDVQIDSLDLRQPKIELIRNPQGVWNFSTLGKSAQATGGPAPQKPAPAFTLADLKIRDGQVAITDYQKRQGRAVYGHLDMELRDYAPDKPFRVTLTARLPGAGTQTVSLNGRGGPIDQNDPLKTPFDGSLELHEVSLAAAKKFVNTQSLQGIEGVASGKVQVRNQQEVLSSSGTLKLTDAQIRGVNIGYPIAADYNLTDDLNNDLLKIEQGNLKLGGTPVSISGTMNMNPTPAQLDMRVNASNVSIEEAARLAAALGVAFNPGMQIRGRMNADLRAQGAVTQPAMNGSLSAQDLTISGKDLAQPVAVKSIELALTPDAIRSNSFTASTGSTSVNAQFALLHYTSPSPAVDAVLRTSGAQVGELLNIAKAYGVSAVEGMSGTGVISLDLHAVGPLKNASAMNFSGNGALQNAALHMPQLAKPLQVRNAGMQFTQNSVALQNLAASLGQTNASGTLTLRNFAAPVVQFNLTADKVVVGEWQQMFTSGTMQPQRASRWELLPLAYAAPSSPSMISQITGGGTLSIGSILYDQLVLTNARTNANLDHGLVRLTPLTAQLYGGQETGSVVIDTRPTPMTYTVAAKLDHVDANKLLSSISSIKQLYGVLTANANTQFTASSADQIARSLNGSAALDLRDGKLVGIDMLNELARVAKFVGFNRAPSNVTNLVQLGGNFNVQNGVARTDDLKAVIDGGTLAAIGAVNLADQTLNMRVTAVLSKAMSDAVGGTGIGGFMNTALANNRGELVIPVIVSGTLDHPSFAPDLQTIAQMKLQNMLPTMNNPGILGAILGNSQNQGAGQKQQQQGGLEGILGAIGGNKRQQQPPPQQQPIGQQPPQQQERRQQNNPVTDILNSVFGNSNQQQQQQQQQENQQQQQNKQPPR